MPTLVIALWLNLACAAAMLGIPGVLVLALLPSGIGREATAEAWLLRLSRRLLRWALLAVGLGMATGALWLAAETAALEERSLTEVIRSLGPIATVLERTQFGHVLLIRLVAMIVLAGLLLVAHRAVTLRRLRLWTCLAAIDAALGMLALAWAGHAAAYDQPIQLAADAAHLVAAGLWLGGLVALAAMLAAARRARDSTSVALAAAATHRFSPLGIACVATLVVTGLVNCWFLVGTIPALIGTPYGQMLLVKIALFLAMLTLAAINRQRLTPMLAAAAARHQPRVAAQALRGLRRNAVAEMSLGVLLLGIVGLFGTVPPALHEQPWWPLSWRFSGAALATPEFQQEIAVAAIAATAGAVAFVYGLVRRRHRLVAVPLGIALMACFAPSFRLLAVTAYPTSFYRSPVAYTTASIARGAEIFAAECVTCHGPRGKGDGPGAAGLRVPPADLTAAHILDHRDGDLFWWLSAGIPESGMPGFAGILSEEQRWDLANWVRTLPVGGLDEGLVTEIGDGPAPRAPDFTFETAAGEESSLLDRLRRGPLILVLFTPASDGARLRQLVGAETRLAEAGLGLLALPLVDDAEPPAFAADFLARADASVGTAYRIIATPPGFPAVNASGHLEFLIDRAGYVRALWLPEETAAWADSAALLTLARLLPKHPLQAAATATLHQH